MVLFDTILPNNRLFLYFTWFTRILLAVAFLPSGLKKLLGYRFTLLPVDTPVGFFFEALYRTGFYWHFLGAIQLLAAGLLLIPRTSYFAALIYLPISINIFVLVTAMQFSGTPLVAGLMVLGNVYLLVWDRTKTLMILRTIFQKC